MSGANLQVCCDSVCSLPSRMPKRTDKEQLLEMYLFKGAIDILMSKNGNETDEALWETLFSVALIDSYRYTNPRDAVVPKSSEWYSQILPHYDEYRFKCCLRVSREEFTKVLSMIETNAVFQTRRKDMLPVPLQLAIALYRFGSSGSGASHMKVGQHFGISDCGIIKTCTERVIQALVHLQPTHICWPTPEERCEILEYMGDKLPGCIGFIDGTHINLFEAPLDEHEAYFSRKQKYGIHLQAICDPSLVLRHVFVGYPASVHDARVFTNSGIGSSPETFLSEGQWLAGDSAYKLSKYMVTPFRDNARTGTLTQRRKFNKHFSSLRVKIEQVFGIMKAKFESLRSLRIRVDRNSGHERACRWIMAICVLYNILRPQEELELTPEDDADIPENEAAGGNEDEHQRNTLFQWFLNH